MEQTNRTILFEEINPNVGNLLMYINDETKESVTDDTLKIIDRYLEAASFEDCIEKLHPEIYICLDTINRRVFCTLNKEEALKQGGFDFIHRIGFDNEYPLLRYYIQLIDGGCSYQQDLDKKLVELMFTVQKKEAFYKDYIKILLLFESGEEAEASKKVKELIGNKDNELTILYLLISVAKRAITSINDAYCRKNIVAADNDSIQIEISNISEGFLDELIKLSDKDVERYKEWIGTLGELQVNNSIFKELFLIPILFSEKDEEALKKIYYQNLDYYVRIIDEYWKCCNPLLEKLLGVYSFFKQYDTKLQGMAPKLLISNFAVADIVDNKNMNRLRLFLDTTNEKNFNSNIIWYAIIPRMDYAKEEMGNGIRARFKGNDKAAYKEVNGREEIIMLTELLAKYKIQSFISPITGQHSTAEWIEQYGISEWVDCQNALVQRDTAEYIYPCFPNFALSKEAYMELRPENIKQYGYSGAGKQRLWVKAPAVEAAYVAAGMYSAIQCPVFLAERFRNKINTEIPGTGFRILENGSNRIILSVLKSTMLNYSDNILEDIEKKCSGIFFAPYGNKVMLIQDSAMSKLYGIKDSVGMVQLLTYIERTIRNETQDFKSELIEQFFQKRRGSLMSKWSETEYYNSILKQGESIHYRLDREHRECVFEVSFNVARCERKVHLN